MIFDHDLTQTLSIRVETTVVDRGMFEYKGDKIAIEFHFDTTSFDKEVQLYQIDIYDGLNRK